MSEPDPTTRRNPAPRRLRLKHGVHGTTLPPGAGRMVDALVGGLLGATRSEVLRFIIVSWLTDHHGTVSALMNDGRRDRPVQTARELANSAEAQP